MSTSNSVRLRNIGKLRLCLIFGLFLVMAASGIAASLTYNSTMYQFESQPGYVLIPQQQVKIHVASTRIVDTGYEIFFHAPLIVRGESPNRVLIVNGGTPPLAGSTIKLWYRSDTGHYNLLPWPKDGLGMIQVKTDVWTTANNIRHLTLILAIGSFIWLIAWSSWELCLRPYPATLPQDSAAVPDQ